MKAIDRLIGIHHFFFDNATGDIPEVPPKQRKVNPFVRDAKAIVAKINAGDDIRKSVDQALSILGPLTKAISRGDKVMVKPNFNSDDPPPASTDIPFLKTIIEILHEYGAKVIMGESSGAMWRPTVNVFHTLGLYDFAKDLGVELFAFEQKPNDWVRIPIEGKYLHSVTMPKVAYEADRHVYLPCLKTHMLARYSGALKLAFGFVNPGERRAFHFSFREEKLAEISLCWQPDLIVMDGRKAFVTGGPNSGKLVEPGLILASGDLIAIDVEAVKAMLGYKARNQLMSDPWQMPQITTAVQHGIGVGRDGYVVLP